MPHHPFRIAAALLGIFSLFCAGCAKKDDASARKAAPGTPPSATRATSTVDATNDVGASNRPRKSRFQPVALGDAGQDTGSGTSSGGRQLSGEQRSRAIVAALQPFQVLLGDWRWITNRKFDGQNKSGDDQAWVWDFQHDRQQPALTAKCESHPYFQQLWLSYLPEHDVFQVTLQTIGGETREFRGTWTENGEPREESDGKKLQHTHKLQVTQVVPEEGEQWQITFQQLDNNQFLMTLTRRPPAGKQFGPLDVVRQQREGTSFAVADSDNPGPKCIISGGLGTITVTYKGKSYPVCCTGCAAAFNDDPERWLAKLKQQETTPKRDD